MKGNIKCPCCGLEPSKSIVFIGESIEREMKDKFGDDYELVITSGARCASHNKEVGGKDNSAHLRGLALDIAIQSSVHRKKMLKFLFEIDMKRIGIAKEFLHIDIDKTLPQNVVFIY